jgi:hypothetical protein
VRFVRTTDRSSLRKYRNGTAILVHELKARSVILSAGSLGSTEILSRSNAVHALSLSDKLGSQFSGNGDYLAFGYLQDGAVDGVGTGSRAHAPGDGPVGPTITGVIGINHEDISKCTLIEEGSVPGAIARVFHELITTMATVSQLASKSYRGEDDRNPPKDPLALQPDALTRTQTLLAMGHDCARGTLCYNEEADLLRIAWPQLESEPVYALHDARLRHAEDLGAIYLQNPAWRPLPDSVREALSGPTLGNSMFTVHPLGGCPMGDDVGAGVVDDIGSVYKGSGERHEGLYVLDGSIVPCALGVNPLLTITALAERAMEKIVPGILAQREAAAPGLPEFPKDRVNGAAYANPEGDRVALEFTEVLRGPVQYRASGGTVETRDASLILHLPVADLQRFFEDPSHPIEILGPRGSDVEQLAARFEVSGRKPGEVEEFLVTRGTVKIFERRLATRAQRWMAMLRVALTWFIERGHDELYRELESFLGMTLQPGSKVSLGTMLRDWLRLVGHASETRTFAYDLELWKGERAYRLKGGKLFEYAASWSALAGYAWKWLFSPAEADLYLERTNVWTSLGLLAIELHEDGAVIARGSLTMDLMDMSHRHAAQFASKRDTATALLALAGYPLMFLRAMIKTRLWDFRLPDYPEYVPAELSRSRERVPVPEAGAKPSTTWPTFPTLRDAGRGEAAPRPSEDLRVRRSRHEAGEVLVRLTRYAQPTLESAKTADGMVQVRAIVLINGFAQPTLPFVATEIRQNLAEYFYGLGYDVWLFDYRTSTILDSSREACTMDDVAENDIPAAVNYIVGALARELGADRSKLQIYAFAHCVGSACTAMSMLGGHLRHPGGGGSMIAGVIFSQMQSFLIGGATAQARIPVGSLLRDVAGVDVVRLSAAEGQPTALESLLDRLLATLPISDEERCPHESDRTVDRPDIVTCRRAGGVISRLFNHRRMSEATHRKLDVYFGRANTTLLIHGTKCLDYEHLVNADGQNVYATDANIQRHFRLPICLLHGKDNALFDIESCARTYEQLTRISGRAFARRHYVPIRVRGYAHFDCIVGEDAHRDIFPKLGRFLKRAWRDNAQGLNGSKPAPGPARAVAPVTGPILGWVRREGEAAKARLWIQVNEYEADPASCAMTVLRERGGAPRVETWPIVRMPLERLDSPGSSIPPGTTHVAVAIADLDLPGACDIDMVSVHGTPAPAPAAVAAPAPNPDDPVTWVQSTLSRQVWPRAGPDISPVAADEMLGRLKESIVETRKTALSPNPHTLSRKRRDLPLDDTWTAHIKDATLAGLHSGGPLRFLAGCCRYPGTVFEAVRADSAFRHINGLLQRDGAQPGFMLMLGDQIYADATAGLYDPRSSVEKYRVRYEQAFASREFRRLARQLPLYMVIDDHEIDNDWSRDELAKGRDAESLFFTAMSSFAAYQWAYSPRNLAIPGFNYRFEAGGYRFLVLDTRTQRVRRGRPAVLAEDQIRALEQWLTEAGSDGKPRFIVTGSVLAPGLRNADPRHADAAVDTWQMALAQRREVLDLVRKSGTRNVVFLSGDYHCAATAELDFGGALMGYAVVAPPFYAPYVYANVQVPEVIQSEAIPLGSGAVAVAARVSEGSGFSDIRIEASGAEKWSLRIDTYAMRFEDAMPRFGLSTRQFTLS